MLSDMGISENSYNKNKKKRAFSKGWTSQSLRVFLLIFNILLISTLSLFLYSEISLRPAIAQKKKKEATFRLDFNKARMDEFLKTMSELLRKNILIDHKVPGSVTIVSPKPIPVSKAFTVLKTILAQYGYMPVEEDNIIRVVKIGDAFKLDTELRITTDLGKFDRKEFDKVSKNVTHLVVLNYATPRELISLLKNISTKETKVISFDKANVIVLVGNSDEVLHLVEVAKELDKRSRVVEADDIHRNMHIIHLAYADAEKLAAILTRLRFELPETPPDAKQSDNKTKAKLPVRGKRTVNRIPTRRTASSSGKLDNIAKVDIIANKETNSLIITAPPSVYRDVKQVVKELDIMRSQVLVEALIVEISGDDSWGAGIEWQHGSSINSGNSSLDNTYALGSSTTNLGEDYVNNAGYLPGLTLGLLKGSLETDDGTVTIPNIYALLNLYSETQEINILSTPQILVKDNQEAELNVGQQVPIITNTRLTDQNTTYNTYDLKSVGIKLKITPQINKKRFISLDLYSEIKALVGDVSNLSLTEPPVISERNIKTQITIQDRKTIVIGGLIQSDNNEIIRKTPILGDIPILGWFFKRKTRTKTKTNLLIFITPYIINTPEEMNNITDRKRLEIEKMRKVFKKMK